MGEPSEPLVYDEETADALAAALRLLGDRLTRWSGTRQSLVTAALEQFRGPFSDVFRANANACAGQASSLAAECARASSAVDRARESAQAEKRRREDLRRWEEHQELQRTRPHLAVWAGVRPGEAVPAVDFLAGTVSTSGREHPGPGSGGVGAVGGLGGGGGAAFVVSGDPAALEAFAGGAEGVDRESADTLPRVRGLLSDYAQRCRWGRVHGEPIVAGVGRWSAENDADRVWARVLAAAFVAAGGHADIATVEKLVTGLPAEQWSAVGNALVMVILKDGSAEQIKSFFAANPAALQRFRDSPPPADRVRSWWGGMVPAVRDRLTTAAPEAIGNLPGVPYRARDTANRHWLDTELRTAESDSSNATTALQGVRERHRRQEIQIQVWQLKSRIENLRGLRASLTQRGLGDTKQLVQFFPGGSNPKASVSSGDLDRASSVGVVVPGMGTTLKSAQDNVAATDEILTVATAMRRRKHDHTPMAMVTFLNYDAPAWQGVYASAEETIGQPAVDGGRRLTGLMGEVKGKPGWSAKDSRLTLIGHSYGTTVVGEALKQESADQAVLLASPGVITDRYGRVSVVRDTQVRAVGLMPDLKVPAGGVSAATSSQDPIAPFGLATAEPARANPSNPHAAPDVEQFSADDARVPAGGEGILPGDGVLHGATGHDFHVNDQDPSTWGYADRGSTSNWMAAAKMSGRKDLELK